MKESLCGRIEGERSKMEVEVEERKERGRDEEVEKKSVDRKERSRVDVVCLKTSWDHKMIQNVIS